MPNINRGKQVEVIQSYGGGQNSADEPNLLKPNQVNLIQNGLVISDGTKIKQRLGLTTFLSEANATITGNNARVYGIGRLKYNTTNNLYRSISNGTNCIIQKLKSSLDLWEDVSGLTTLTKEKSTEIIQGINYVIVLNGGSDNIFSINTSNAVADLGSTAGSGHPPKGVAGTWHDGRFWVTDTNGMVYYSDALPALTAGVDAWNQTEQNFTPRSPVVQPLTFKNHELVLYETDSIEVIDTLGPVENWSSAIYNEKVGCVARRTVQDVGNDHIFLSSDGFRLLSRTQFDTVRNGVISDNIQDIIDRISWANVSTAWACVIDNKYIAGIPVDASTYPNMVVVLDIGLFAKAGEPCWTQLKLADWNLFCACIYDVASVPTMVAGSAITTGARNVFKCLNGTTDNGTAISMTINGREHDFQSKDTDKIWSHIFLTADADGTTSTIGLEYRVNRGGFQQCDPATKNLSADLLYPAATVYPSASLFPLVGDQVADVYWVRDRGRNFMPRFTHSTSGGSPSIHTYKVAARGKNTKGG